MNTTAARSTTNSSNDSLTKGELATKRIPVTPEIWIALHDMRKAGESYDDLLRRLIADAQAYRLMRDMDEIEERGEFIPLDDIDTPLLTKG